VLIDVLLGPVIVIEITPTDLTPMGELVVDILGATTAAPVIDAIVVGIAVAAVGDLNLNGACHGRAP